MEDGRCKLGLQGRLGLVLLVEQGSTLRAAAAARSVAPAAAHRGWHRRLAARSVAPATAHRWWHRWLAASPAERASRACLHTRSSRPGSCPWALSELRSAENAQVVWATLTRAVACVAEQGCGPVQAVMSDNAKCYAMSFDLRDTLADLGARHILIPRYNGKIERFFRTLATEWARSRAWPNSQQRDHALSSFIRYYNRRRPHSACGDRPPITRVQRVRGQNS
jgi:transposase InsO family protein